jgi:hypothetical protein
MLEDEVIVISDSDSDIIKRPISNRKNKSIILLSSDDEPIVKGYFYFYLIYFKEH